jgi:hypothetical protein
MGSVHVAVHSDSVVCERQAVRVGLKLPAAVRYDAFKKTAATAAAASVHSIKLELHDLQPTV